MGSKRSRRRRKKKGEAQAKPQPEPTPQKETPSPPEPKPAAPPPGQPLEFSLKKALLVAAVLAAVGLLAYSNSFSVPFLHDGVPSVKENPHIRSLWPIWEAMQAPKPSTLSGRPVASLSFALNHAISGTDVWSYHLFNLLFHVLSALLLFGIIRRTLLSDPLKDKLGGSATILALFSSAIWLVHPLHTTAVTYLVQRTESLMGLFYLLTFYCAVRAFASEKKNRWYIAALVACALGMGTKESMLTVPVAILIYDRIFVSRSFKELFSSRWWFYLLLAATWAIVLLLVFSGSRALASSPAATEMTTWRYSITQFEAIVAVYLKLSFWPHPLVFDYGAPYRNSLLEVLPYALVVMILLAATVWALIRKPAAGFLGIWFFLNLTLTSSVINLVAETIAERRMYLSLAAVAAGAVIGAYLLLKRLRGRTGPAIGAMVGCLAIAALGAATFVRNGDFKSGEAIWQDTVNKWPGNVRAWANLGNQHSKNGKYSEALKAFEAALKSKPYFAAYAYQGMTYDKMGKPEKAIQALDRAIELNPGFAESYHSRGLVLAKTGNLQKALQDLDRAIELKPDFAEALDGRGSVYDRMGRPKDAIRDFNRAIAMKPYLAEAYSNRGNSLARLGKRAQAFRNFKKALNLNPGLAEAYLNRGALYDDTGEFKKAIADFDRAIELKPDFAGAYGNRATAYGHLGNHADSIRDLNKAIELAPDDSDLYNKRGIANGKSGNKIRALEDFKRAIELNPDNANAVLNAGITLESLGKTQDAVKHYRQALRLRSNWPIAQQRLSRLEGKL